MVEALNWILDFLLGPVIFAAGTLTISLIGFKALLGDLDFGRAARVVMGIFIVTAAPQIANALISQSGVGSALERFPEFSNSDQELQREDPNSICWTC